MVIGPELPNYYKTQNKAKIFMYFKYQCIRKLFTSIFILGNYRYPYFYNQ